MLRLSCYWTFILYFVCVVPLFLILQNLFLYLALNMLICLLYLDELQATCPCCILNTTILSNLKIRYILNTISCIYLQKTSGAVILFYSPFPSSVKPILLNTYTHMCMLLSSMSTGRLMGEICILSPL